MYTFSEFTKLDKIVAAFMKKQSITIIVVGVICQPGARSHVHDRSLGIEHVFGDAVCLFLVL